MFPTELPFLFSAHLVTDHSWLLKARASESVRHWLYGGYPRESPDLHDLETPPASVTL